MKTDSGVKKNTAALIAREVLNKGSIFILLILIGRIMGKEALGIYSVAFAVSQIFFFGAELGLNTLVIREVTKDRETAPKALVNIGLIRVVVGLLAILLICGSAVFLGAHGEAAAVICLCGASYFFVNLINLYTSVFRAFEKMELDLLAAFIKAAIFLPAAAWMIFNGFGLTAIFSLFLASNILTLIITHLIFLWQIGAPRWELDRGFCMAQLTQTSSLWLLQLFGITYLKLAPIILDRRIGHAAAGLYNAGFVVVDGFWALAGCFACAVFPRICQLCHSSMHDGAAEYWKGLRSMAVFFAIAGIVFILAAPYIVPLFYGSKFTEIIPLFRILAAAAVLVALDTHSSLTAIAIGKQALLALINLSAVALNLVLNLFFIARMGYTGSAYAFLITEAWVFALLIISLKKFLLKPGLTTVKT